MNYLLENAVIVFWMEIITFFFFLLTASPSFPSRSVTQSCPALCDSTDCGLPRSSVDGILQARILEWVAIPFSRRSLQPRDGTRISCIGRQILNHLNHQGSPVFLHVLLFITETVPCIKISILDTYDSRHVLVHEKLAIRDYINKSRIRKRNKKTKARTLGQQSSLVQQTHRQCWSLWKES